MIRNSFDIVQLDLDKEKREIRLNLPLDVLNLVDKVVVTVFKDKVMGETMLSRDGEKKPWEV